MVVEEFIIKLFCILIAFAVGMMNAGYALHPAEPFLFLLGYALPWVCSLLVVGPALGAVLCGASHLLLSPLTRANARWAVLVGVYLAAIGQYLGAFIFADAPGAVFWKQNSYAAIAAVFFMYIATPFPNVPWSSVSKLPRHP
jgi:hypothetical protein